MKEIESKLLNAARVDLLKENYNLFDVFIKNIRIRNFKF